MEIRKYKKIAMMILREQDSMLNCKPYATSWLDHFDIALILNGKADYKIKEFQQKQ